ncbi:MAG TPA: hypothetical protein VMU14_20130 [Acidimicrobiales bacterium]|nr:hypothetical protein [Acidimicrobiales bacterium]
MHHDLAPVAPLVEEPDDELLDGAAAAWLTLRSCRDMADADTGLLIGAAMASLDDAALLASALPPAERRPWIDELRDIDAMAWAIHAHLRAHPVPRGDR